jgi:hypothetical protein
VKGRRRGVVISGGGEGRRQGGSTVREANGTVKSGAVAGEAECGSGWRLEGGLNVRLGRTVDWASKKNMAETMR